MKEYVLPEDEIPEPVSKIPATEDIDQSTEDSILALDDINEFTVRGVLRTSRKHARQILDKLHDEGKIKTKQERLRELYPPEEPKELDQQIKK